MGIRETDIWRCGIVQAPLAQIMAAGSLAPFPLHWLPEEPSLCFLADPFGFWHDGHLHVFAEHYDYRTRKGRIKVLVLDSQFAVLEQRVVLEEPWHLSYPVVFAAEGEIWMLPEGYKSGRLSLYRARQFPWQWEAVPGFDFPCAAIDASPLQVDGRWWMFYTPPAAGGRTRTLQIAVADRLLGPWQDIAAQPVRPDVRGSRMGGTPQLLDGQLVLPAQDCQQTYGGAIRLLRTAWPFSGVPELVAEACLGPTPAFGDYQDGLHTLSAAGEVTLIDAKRILRHSPRRLLVELGRLLRRRD